MNDDEIMNAVLQVLEQNRAKARSDKQLEMRMSSIKVELRRNGHDISQQQTVSALDYLKDSNYVQVINKVKSVPTSYTPAARSLAKTRGVKLQAAQKFNITTYKIKQKGIDRVKGKTSFSKEAYTPSITVNAENSVVVVGHQNNVEANADILRKLNELEQVISEADSVDVETRQDAVADIETVKQQMAKSNPSKEVISTVWSGIEKAAAASGATQLVGMVAKALGIGS